MTVVAQVIVVTIWMNAFPSVTHNSALTHVADDIGMLDLWVSERRFDQIRGQIDLDESMTRVSVAELG